MKILYIRSNGLNQDSRFKKEVQSLDKVGHEVFAFSWNRDENHKINKTKIFSRSTLYNIGIKSSFGIGIKGIFPFLKFQIAILFFIISNRKNFDIIHACDFDTGLTVWLITRIIRKKYVYDIYDYYIDSHRISNQFKSVVAYLENVVINSSEVTIICTEKRLEQISDSNPKQVVIIHNSPSKINYKRGNHENVDSKLKIAYFGIFGNGRMLPELLEIVHNDEFLELHIGGYGLLEKIVVDYAEKSENIKFYGKLDYEDVVNKEGTCDVLTALYDPNDRNHYYAAPNKFYEAAMLGLPVIMAKNTGMSELVSEYGNGINISTFSSESLKLAFKKLTNDYVNYHLNSLKFKELFSRKYSWEIMEKRLEELYLNIESK